MNPNLKAAIIHFLADEFKLEPNDIGSDTDFQIDLDLNPDQLTDLIERMQDALDFVLPEDKINSISSVGDLFIALTESHDGEPE